MLEELVILNGELSLKFDPLNTKYTVTLNNDDLELDFQYKLKDGVQIKIEGNEFLEDGSIVVVTVYNEQKSVDYYFNIYRESTEETTKTFSELMNVELETKKEISVYAGPGIACICFLLILFLFTFLFHKKRVKKRKFM